MSLLDSARLVPKNYKGVMKKHRLAQISSSSLKISESDFSHWAAKSYSISSLFLKLPLGCGLIERNKHGS
jgi:hypothetical protein